MLLSATLAHHQRRQHPIPPLHKNRTNHDALITPSANNNLSWSSSHSPSSATATTLSQLAIDPTFDSQFQCLSSAPLYHGLSASPGNPSNYYMQENHSSSPPNRVQQANPKLPPTHYQPDNQGVTDSTTTQAGWNQYNQYPHLSRAPAQQRFRLHHRAVGHKRNTSGSTTTSTTGSSSPFTPTSASYPQPQILDPDSQQYSSFADSYDPQSLTLFPKPLPSHSSANFTDSLSSIYPNLHNAQSQYIQQLAMRQMAPHQGSDLGNGRTLPRTSSEFSEDSRPMMDQRNAVPKLDRTMSDIYQDELYNTSAISAPPPPPPPPPPQQQQQQQQQQPPRQTTAPQINNLLSPKRDVFTERLQAANDGHISARSGSPATTLSRDRSPFQPTSEFVHDEIPQNTSNSPRFGTAAQIRERQKAESDARVFAQHHGNAPIHASQTISPKEALLDPDENEGDTMPSLFPSEDTSGRFGQQFQSFPTVKREVSSNTPPASQQSFASMVTTARESSSGQSASSSNEKRTTPQTTQPYPFISRPRRQTSSMQSTTESVPDFPAHLTSMDSTKSEAPSSQSDSDESSSEVQRPFNTSSDAGTYTCTYQNCTMRFETPAKLQRHKRDGHRQGTPPSVSGSDTIANRNTQAGPHECNRINPSTGKPCNSIFSRPYDLTRHEDTIHNARKQKVKCQFCTEDKTFSRNDALTRHMRVVHPEVDFPGKTKRRGGM